MINFKIYTSHEALPKSWDELNKQDVLLQSNYLCALERSLPKNMTLYYIAVFDHIALIGIALIQCVNFKLKDTIRQKSSLSSVRFFKNQTSKLIKGTILVVGNLTHTGQHSLCYNKELINKEQFVEQLFKALKQLKKDIKTEQKKRVRLIMLKDYFEDDPTFYENKFIDSLPLRQSKVQPSMIMHIRDHWLQGEDYLADKKTKYRTRYKRARKKLNDLKIKELNLKDIEKSKKTLYDLYRNVSDKAPFNTFILPQNHFFELKKALTDRFKVFGYFKNERLVGFYTLINNKKTLETYFLGYDLNVQKEHQLYLNMIYNMVFFGIEHKFRTIVFARTAMEIKSSIGAKPYDMKMYMMHTSTLGNSILKWVFNFMKPDRNWQERNPFKEPLVINKEAN